ncbi:MAG: outer membrane beta-barrel protein [Thiohalomonadales bacterium]
MIGRNSVLALFVFIAFLTSTAVHASHSKFHELQNGYFGFAGVFFDDDNFNTGGGALISGLDLNSVLAIEGHLGLAAEDSYRKANNDELRTQINYFSTLRLRFNYHMRNMIPYAYLGYSAVNMTTTTIDSNTGKSTTLDNGHAGFSYGLGIDLFGSQRTSIFISTGMFLDKNGDGVDLNLLSTMVGFRYFLSRPKPIKFW